MKSRSPSARKETNASAVRASVEKSNPWMSTPESSNVLARKWPKGSSPTFPMNPLEMPSRDTPTATLAGAPPGAFLKAGASSSETPETVGTKSINNSPQLMISGI